MKKNQPVQLCSKIAQFDLYLWEVKNLEHRGLERIRSHGADGFERTVALSVLAANLHRIGLLLQRRER